MPNGGIDDEAPKIYQSTFGYKKKVSKIKAGAKSPLISHYYAYHVPNIILLLNLITAMVVVINNNAKK